MKLRTIVVDDEALGRRGITSRLTPHPGVELVAECANGREAVAAVLRHDPDLLFLDVQMPGMNGFEVLARLPSLSRPRVIFVTAHDEHAVRAFEVNALDYLLKPIDDGRFARALERAIMAGTVDRDGELGRRVAALVGATSPDARPPVSDRIAVRAGGRITFVRHADIDWIEAAGDYARLHAGTRSWLVRRTMADLEGELGRRRFLRIHRSTIVNIDRVTELRSFDNGDYAVILRNGVEMRLSRTFHDALARLTGR